MDLLFVVVGGAFAVKRYIVKGSFVPERMRIMLEKIRLSMYRPSEEKTGRRRYYVDTDFK